MEDWEQRFSQLQSLLGREESVETESRQQQHLTNGNSDKRVEFNTPTRPPPPPILRDHTSARMEEALRAIRDATQHSAPSSRAASPTHGREGSPTHDWRPSRGTGHAPTATEGMSSRPFDTPAKATDSPVSSISRSSDQSPDLTTTPASDAGSPVASQGSPSDPIKSAVAFAERMKASRYTDDEAAGEEKRRTVTESRRTDGGGESEEGNEGSGDENGYSSDNKEEGTDERAVREGSNSISSTEKKEGAVEKQGRPAAKGMGPLTGMPLTNVDQLSHFDLKSQLEGVAAAAANQEGLPGVVASVVASAIAGAVSQLDEYKSEVEKLKKENARQKEELARLSQLRDSSTHSAPTSAEVSAGEQELLSVLDQTRQEGSKEAKIPAAEESKKGLLTTTGFSKTIAQEDASNPMWPFNPTLPSLIESAKAGEISGLCKELARIGKVAIELRQHNRLLRCIVDALKDEAMRRQKMQQEQISLLKERIAELVEQKEELSHLSSQLQSPQPEAVAREEREEARPSQLNQPRGNGAGPKARKKKQPQSTTSSQSSTKRSVVSSQALVPAKGKPAKEGIPPSSARGRNLRSRSKGTQRSRSLGFSLRDSRASDYSDGDEEESKAVDHARSKARQRLVRWKQTRSSHAPIGRVLSKMRPRSNSAHRASKRQQQVDEWNETAKKYLMEEEREYPMSDEEYEEPRAFTPEPDRMAPTPSQHPSRPSATSPSRAMPSVEAVFAPPPAGASSFTSSGKRSVTPPKFRPHMPRGSDEKDVKRGRPWTGLGPPLGLGRSAYRNVRSSGYGQRREQEQPQPSNSVDPMSSDGMFSPPSRVSQLLEAAGVVPRGFGERSMKDALDQDEPLDAADMHTLPLSSASGLDLREIEERLERHSQQLYRSKAQESQREGSFADSSRTNSPRQEMQKEPAVSMEALRLLSSVQRNVPTPRALSKYDPLGSGKRG